MNTHHIPMGRSLAPKDTHMPPQQHQGAVDPLPRPPHNQPFLNPLLPPSEQDARPTLSAPPSHFPAPVSPHFYTPPPAFQAQPFVAHVQHQTRNNAHPPPSSNDSNTSDGYNLSFPSIEAFQRWRAELEESDIVEFIKEPASPPNPGPYCIAQHTRLVCSRQFKGVRDKYAKPCPERRRVSPSHKNEAEGCPASISYKVCYGGEPGVHAMYFHQHSHPIGPENLPFTRRGRKPAEYDNKLLEQGRFSRINPELNGTGSSAVQGAAASKNKELRAEDALRNDQPPPMGRLAPPGGPPNFIVDALPYQKQHVPGVVQERSYPPVQAAQASFQSQVPASSSPLTTRSTTTYEQSYIGNPSQPPEAPVSASAPPYLGHSNHVYAYQQEATSNFQNGQVHQPQPNHVIHQLEVHDHQSQYLPTPTTPSSQIQTFTPPQSHPNSHAAYAHFSHHDVQAQPAQGQTARTFDTATHASPVSPITPQTRSITHPPINSQVSISQQQQQHVYPQNVLSSEDRWNRLEALFQAIKLRARSQVLPEPAISTLETLLLQLYSEGERQHQQSQQQPPPLEQQQGYPRPENNQIYREQAMYR
ncbi:uncharacterized protein FOMMEDRAFT_166996 [Fomitiporia mediterranea MF3/22]|uniref:uncharacterized protein n=1 Tax=Fomitiporia mediterranea (strain MF3/22) TaxID=694068 RepID=UPI0004408FBE|nr:uncharacterized protein FOMMEDRAFT_166996 [Fomitiporia mediterranea MF3/22]EJD03644.1 hypothetical protein FOMMEDRAFT_166996 [Fomitiporia mediterranea MF3/22]